jgi:hypothetical protein
MQRVSKLLGLLVFVAMPAAYGQEPNYDSRWWRTLSAEEHVSFLQGETDCYVFDAKGRQADDKSTVYDAPKKVTEYYQSNPQKLSATVLSVLRSLSKPHRIDTSYGRHFYYDGDYWRKADHSQRATFVRGYLACREMYLHSRVDKPIDFYVGQLSSWYKVSDTDESELSEKTGNDKIGDILVRLLRP